MPLTKGLTHVYTGDGKGKTTAAFGLCLRALGRGLRVLVVQFLKGGGKLSGEAKEIDAHEGSQLICFDDQRHPIFFKKGEGDIGALVKSISDGFAMASEKIHSGEFDLVVLDEINNCLKEGWVSAQDIVDLIKEKPVTLELVLTGRGCPDEVMAVADYVTEMKMIKHPAESGTKARKGVEF